MSDWWCGLNKTNWTLHFIKDYKFTYYFTEGFGVNKNNTFTKILYWRIIFKMLSNEILIFWIKTVLTGYFVFLHCRFYMFLGFSLPLFLPSLFCLLSFQIFRFTFYRFWSVLNNINSNICIVPDFTVNGSKVLPLSTYIFLYIKSILEIYIY